MPTFPAPFVVVSILPIAGIQRICRITSRWPAYATRRLLANSLRLIRGCAIGVLAIWLLCSTTCSAQPGVPQGTVTKPAGSSSTTFEDSEPWESSCVEPSAYLECTSNSGDPVTDVCAKFDLPTTSPMAAQVIPMTCFEHATECSEACSWALEMQASMLSITRGPDQSWDCTTKTHTIPCEAGDYEVEQSTITTPDSSLTCDSEGCPA